MTTQTQPETQLTLPGQAATAEGPVDLTAMFVMHHAFRRDLNAFVAAAHRTPAGDTPTWRALHQRWEMFGRFLHHHHSGEDAGLWPMLMDRADAAGRTVLAAMEAEHADIDPLLAKCSAGFATLASRVDEDTRAALQVRLVAARELLEAHLRHEEGEALPLVQSLLTPEDWHRLDEEHFKPAYGPREMLAVLPWVLYELPAPARRRILADRAGRVLETVWRLLLRRPFERRERRAFRY
ncbi:MAG TPA: hemerythrin domain-containing protein [Actinoplanes sp.]